MSADYKSGFRLAISRTVLEKWAKCRKITKFGLNLTPTIFLGGRAPKIWKPVLGTPFQGLLPQKFWTTPSDPNGLGKNFAPKFFFGGRGPPKGTQVRHRDPLPLVKIWSECDPWPLSKASFNIELFKLWPPSNFLGEPQKFWNQFWILVLRAYSHNKFGPRTPTLVFNIGGFGAPKF